MLVSVVVPVKEERDNIRPLFERVRDALKGGPAWELVYVDDGSTDDTFAEIETLTATDPRLFARSSLAGGADPETPRPRREFQAPKGARPRHGP